MCFVQNAYMVTNSAMTFHFQRAISSNSRKKIENMPFILTIYVYIPTWEEIAEIYVCRRPKTWVRSQIVLRRRRTAGQTVPTEWARGTRVSTTQFVSTSAFSIYSMCIFQWFLLMQVYKQKIFKKMYIIFFFSNSIIKTRVLHKSAVFFAHRTSL